MVLDPDPVDPTKRIFCSVRCSRYSGTNLLVMLFSVSPQGFEDLEGTGSDKTAQTSFVPA